MKVGLSLATALGSPIPYEDRLVIFKPDLEISFSFTVSQGSQIEAYIRTDSELEPYVKLIDPKPLSGNREVIVEIKLGDALSPGEHRITVGARETAGKAQGISAVAGVETAIRIRSLSSEKIINGYIDVNDVNEGENVSLNVYVQSWSYQDVNSIYADVNVFNGEGNKTGHFRTNEIALKSGTTSSMNAIMETHGLQPGWYTAFANIFYDGKNVSDADDFRIGTLKVDIVGHTKELKADSLNKFDINVQSNWNQLIKNVYGEVEWEGERQKTPTIEIPRFGEGTLITYLDTHHVAAGEKPIKMWVYFNGENSERTGMVQVAKPEKIIEAPAKITSNLTYIYLALDLLVLLNLLLLIGLRRRSSNKANLPPK